MLTLILALLLLFLIIQHLKHHHGKLKNRVFYVFVLLSALFLINILRIPWTSDADANLLISFSIIWLSYIPFVLKFAHSQANHSGLRLHRARQHLGTHVRNMSDDELHSHLKH